MLTKPMKLIFFNIIYGMCQYYVYIYIYTTYVGQVLL